MICALPSERCRTLSPLRRHLSPPQSPLPESPMCCPLPIWERATALDALQQQHPHALISPRLHLLAELGGRGEGQVPRSVGNVFLFEGPGRGSLVREQVRKARPEVDAAPFQADWVLFVLVDI